MKHIKHNGVRTLINHRHCNLNNSQVEKRLKHNCPENKTCANNKQKVKITKIFGPDLQQQRFVSPNIETRAAQLIKFESQS